MKCTSAINNNNRILQQLQLPVTGILFYFKDYGFIHATCRGYAAHTWETERGEREVTIFFA